MSEGAGENKRMTGSILVERFGSPIRRPHRQRSILLGLGLAGSKRRRVLSDTPENRAMAAKLSHMVRILEPKGNERKGEHL